VPTFAETAKPLTALTRKNPFTWGPSQQKTFDTLKLKLRITPVLAFPNISLPFILTDASNVAVAAILFQVQNGVERPIAFASRQNNKAEQAYPASESEMQPNFFVFTYLAASSWPEPIILPLST